jgi:RNA polymerase sigma factor (sigma-70 family)
MVHSQLPAVPERSVARPEGDGRRERLAGLLDAARAKGEGALDAIVAELSPLLWHVARSQGLDRAASEDVVQTTWLSLLRGLGEIRTPEALIGWLVTVTRREAWRVRDAGRRQLPVDEHVFVSLRDTDSAPDEQFVDHERRRALWAAVNRLSPRCQQLLRIVAFVHRPNYDVVAESLGLPRGSIGPTRGRCLQKLRDLLGSDPQWSAQ